MQVEGPLTKIAPNYLDVVKAIFIGWNLKGQGIEFDTVVVADRPLILFATDVLKRCPGPRDKHVG